MVALSLPISLAVLSLAAQPKLLVVDLEVRGADPALQQGTTRLVVNALTESGRFEVLAGDDVHRALSLAAQKEQAGCDDAACFDEVAGALGAELVVFGDLTKLGDQTLLTLNLFDTHDVRSIARATAPLEGEHARDVVAHVVHDVVHDYDASRGAFPLGTVAVVGGAAGIVAALAVAGVGAWQMALLGDDTARHDRLLAEYLKSPEPRFVDGARDVQRSADAHFTWGAVALAASVPLAAAGIGAVAFGVLE